MAMLTRCPHCDTVFRVTPQQLQRQHGQVRCGCCAQVFDGFRSLSSESDRTVARAVAEHRPAESGGVAPAAPPPEAADPGVAAAVPLTDAPVEAAAPAVAPSVAPSAATVPASPAVEREPAPAPEASATVPHARSRVRQAWAAGVAVLGLVLALQAVYAYRVAIAAQIPALKPVLAGACDALGCSVPLPRDPRYLSIEASDLQVPDPTRPGVIQLTATVRSHATYDLAYPALDLVLTDAQEHTLARRVFLPREYLDPRRSAAAGIPPNAEVTLKLDLDIGELGAAGFRLDLLAAPG